MYYKYIPFVVTLFIAFFSYVMLFKENNRLTKENLELVSHINTQNEQILKQKIDLENYKCDLDSMKEYAINEYKKAFEKTKNDKTCEGKLKHLETILKSYE